MAGLTLYARRTSSNSQKVLWFLGELGVPYEFVATGGDAGGLDDPLYRALNPSGRVPTLVDGDFPVWESHSILRYLAAVHGGATWWEEDPQARSRVDRWLDWSQDQFDDAFMRLFWGYWRTPGALRNAAANQIELERLALYVPILDQALGETEYVAGRWFSIADVAIGALAYRYVELDVTDDLPPNVARWYASLELREPFRTHVMLPIDDLKGRLAF